MKYKGEDKKQEEKKNQKKRIRSPNYPSLPLERSLRLVEALSKDHNRYFVPLEVAGKCWEISAKSSYMAQHIAALAAYGLIDSEGEKNSKKIKVSDLAFKILMDKRPDSEEREALIKEAALKPNIFKKIYETYPTVFPADASLDYELKTTHGFNPTSVSDFIDIFKQTFEFAKVYKSAIMGEEKIPIKEAEMLPTTDKIPFKELGKEPKPLREGEREIANYPVGKGLKARILFSGGTPITIESIDKLIKLLELNKEDLPESNEEEN
jgi:hypothetical protein